MNTQRLVVLGLALVAAGGAAFLVRSMLGGGTPAATATPAPPPVAMSEVLVASANLQPGQALAPDQVRWGLENLALDQKKLDALGFAGVLRPISTSCQDHMGSTWARIHTWDGKQWKMSSDWYQADEQIIKPMVKAGADKYLADKKLQRRTPADCQS